MTTTVSTDLFIFRHWGLFERSV